MRLMQKPQHVSNRRPTLLLVCAVAFLSFAGTTGSLAQQSVANQPVANSPTDNIGFPQGIAAGDVTPSSVVLWTRTHKAAELRLQVSKDSGFKSAEDLQSFELQTTQDKDFTVQQEVDGLEASTLYHYRFAVSDPQENPSTIQGTFRTAPKTDASHLPSFLVAGDVGGQAICRHRERGYAAFRPMAELGADFFVANGDMIYADNPCPPVGHDGWPNIPGDFPAILNVDWSVPGAAKEAILGHWRYNRADPHQQALLAATPIYVQWDDHEVINDFGAPWPHWPNDPERAGYPTLVKDAKDALFEFNPIRPHPDEPQRIYRSFRWGKYLELFLLDARSYRDANDKIDGPDKTLLGAEQLAWLKKGLKESDATWKIVSSDVPLSFPTGWEAELWGRDAFASGERKDFSKRTGFEHELLDWLTFVDRENIENMVVVVTDVHFAANLRYDLDLDGDGDRLLFHELINGPLNAYKLPVPPKPDETLKPIILYAEGGIFNFSYVRLEEKATESGKAVHLIAEIHDDKGEVRFGSRLELAPR